MKSHYDFSQGIRGKYAQRFRQGVNLVLLDPDVATSFPDAQSVNQALRELIRVAKSSRPARRTRKRTLASETPS